MAEKNPEFDPFVKNRMFPDSTSLFANLPSLDETFNKAVVVLDTSVLFAPYDVGKDSLDDIKKAYKKLAKENRLIVPAQVAREYAARRVEKLSEIIKTVADLRSKPQMVEGTVSPMLDSMKSYGKFKASQKKANAAIKECQDGLDSIVEELRGWDAVDPVRSFYHEVFTPDVIVELDGNEEEHLNEHTTRLKSLIPPAFRDAKKPDKGIGDFLIWKTILQVGKVRKTSVILVSQDHKDDWCHKAEDRLFSPRAELVEEFKRETGGETFYLISFGELLKHTDARAETIQQVKIDNRTKAARKRRTAHAVRKKRISALSRRERFAEMHSELLACSRNGTVTDALNILEGGKSFLAELSIVSKYKISKQVDLIKSLLTDAALFGFTYSDDDFWTTVLECFDEIATILHRSKLK